MNSLQKVHSALEKIASCKEEIRVNVKQIQQIVWNEDFECSNEINSVLSDLAYDLDFFQSEADIRSMDGSYYGYDRLFKEIEDAMAKLNPERTGTND